MTAFKPVVMEVSNIDHSPLLLETDDVIALHFKLAVTKDPEESYEDVEFQYTPRLDSSRDHDLIELLPEYLTEEITFSRMNAAPFYARIMETLMKKRAIEPVG